MLSVEVPGIGPYEIEYLVLDVNGTLAVDGELLPGVREAVDALKPLVRIVALTADMYGTCMRVAEQLDIEVRVVAGGFEAESKSDFIDELGGDSVVAIGNGANDELMLRGASIGIAVLGREGCSAAAARAADILSPSITDALGLLIEPKRLIATLRR